MKTLGLVSRSLPPMVIGSPILLHNLFESYTGKVVAVSGWQQDSKIDDNFQLKADVIHHLRFKNKFIQKIFESRSHWIQWYINHFVYQKLKKGKVDIVMGVCPSGEYFVAAYKASLRLKVPFYAHMHDLWEENREPGTPSFKLATEHESTILRKAKRVFCMTDVQKDHYEQKYGINCDLLPHTIKTEHLPEVPYTFDASQYDSPERTIVYTGNVNRPINIDAMQQFIRCIDHLPETYKIKVFISLSEIELKAIDLFHPRVSYEWKSMEDIKKEIEKAHVLFLPLSFKNCSPMEVKTVFATKTLDYLTSGTPILQFCPEDAFHTQSAKNGNWAYCVTVDDPLILSKAFDKLVSDLPLCEQLVDGAIREAYSRKSDIHSARLSDFLEGDLGN